MNFRSIVQKRYAETDLAASSAASEHVAPKKRGRGRPSGTFGSREMRAFLKPASGSQNQHVEPEMIPIDDESDTDPAIEFRHADEISLVVEPADSEKHKHLGGSHLQKLAWFSHEFMRCSYLKQIPNILTVSLVSLV